MHLVRLFEFVFVALISFSKHGQSDDQSVLLAFKNEVTHDPHGILATWSPDVPYCNWTGITCHPKHPGRIQIIQLVNRSLSGTITPQLGQLEHLNFMDLEFNNFTGKLPPEIGNCTALKELGISSNSLTGVIPDVFHRLVHLTGLAFFNNRLEGPIPKSLQNCSKLQALALQTNSLTGPIPEIFHTLQDLSTLYLFENELQGSIPLSLWNISEMINLELSTNNLSGQLPQEIHSIPNLRDVSLYGNRLEGRIPSWLANCTKLEILILAQNRITGEIPMGFGVLPRLQALYLQFNKLSGRIPLDLANSSTIERLLVQSNLLTGSLPEHWYAPKLVYLFLSGNSLVGHIPESLGNSTSMFHLSLDYNELSGSIPTTLGSLSQMERLILDYNKLTGVIPASSLLPCKRLGILTLGGNNLQGVIPEELGQIRTLTDLRLEHNQLTGGVPASFGELSRLQNLNLSNNALTGKLPDSLSSLGSTMVNVFDVSSNNLQGTIPAWIGQFDKVLHLSLAGNYFTGQITASIGDCKGLIVLNLSHNSLSGEIPGEVGELKSLELLDLSVNQLSGPIPDTLTALTDMQVINLSFNRLEGQIPSGGAFSKLRNISLEFMGNPLLCGEAINTACPQVHMQDKKSSHLKWTVPLATVGALLLVLTSIFVLRSIFFRTRTKALSFKQVKRFSYKDLSSMTNCFSDTNLVGEGGFSKVYRGELDRKPVAVKVFKRLRETRKTFLAEAKTVAKLRHRNIIKVIGYCSSDQVMALVMEYMVNRSLKSYLCLKSSDCSKDGLDMKTKLSIAIDIAQGLQYMHQEFDVPVIHCDLKPDNVLLDADFTARIADFGISKFTDGGRDHASVSCFKGTIGYAPPEYAISPVVSTRGDIYSFGMLLLVMSCEMSPTDDKLQLQDGGMRAWVLENISKTGEEDATRMVMIRAGLLCTISEPSMRPTSKELLSMLLQTPPVEKPALEVLLTAGNIP